jgi:hypothetical protein
MSKTSEFALIGIVAVLGSSSFGCGNDKPAQDPTVMTGDPSAPSSPTPPTDPTATAPATPEATPPTK